MSIDFSKAIVADAFLAELLSQALQEGFVASGADPHLAKLYQQRVPNSQDALALLVLFDNLILADFSTSFHLPKLEEMGLVQMVHLDGIPYDISTSPTDSALANSFEQILLEAKDLRSIVLNRVIIDLEDENSWSHIAEFSGITKYEACSQALDYIYGFYFDKENIPETNIILRLPSELRITIDRDLGNKNQGLVGPTQMLFSRIILATHQITNLDHLMSTYQSGLATKDYTGMNSGFHNIQAQFNNPLQVANSFHIVRSVLHKEILHFPRIYSIEHALQLREDSNLKSFRDQLIILHKTIAMGDHGSIDRIVADVRKANSTLKFSEQSSRVLNLASYVLLSADVIGYFANISAPITIAISAVTSLASAGVAKLKKKQEWVLFGK